MGRLLKIRLAPADITIVLFTILIVGTITSEPRATGIGSLVIGTVIFSTLLVALVSGCVSQKIFQRLGEIPAFLLAAGLGFLVGAIWLVWALISPNTPFTLLMKVLTSF